MSKVNSVKIKEEDLNYGVDITILKFTEKYGIQGCKSYKVYSITTAGSDTYYCSLKITTAAISKNIPKYLKSKPSVLSLLQC